MSWALDPTKKKKQTNKYTREEKYKSRGRAGGDEYKDLGVNKRNRRRKGGVGFSRSTRFLRIICKKDSSASSSLGRSKWKSKPEYALAAFCWKASHPEAH